MPDKEYFKRYRQEHKEAIYESHRQWKKANPDRMRQYYHNYKRTHQEDIIRRTTEYVRRTQTYRRKLLSTIKLHYGCQNPNCQWQGEFDPCCLEFHHIKEKEFNIGCNNVAFARLMNEVNKCVVLCANCHKMERWGTLDASQLPLCCVNESGEIIQPQS